MELSDEELSSHSDKLSGQSIVVSGVFSLHSRDEYKAMIEQHGGSRPKVMIVFAIICSSHVDDLSQKALGGAASQETEGSVLWFVSDSGSAGGGGAGRRTSANCMVPVWSTM